MSSLETAPADTRAHGWIDLCDPSPDEVAGTEAMTGLHIPTREAISEIENSSRLYVENGAVYVNVPVTIAGVYDEPKASPLGIILSADWLITVHFDRLPVLEATIERFRSVDPRPSSIEGYLQLIEATIEVEADQIERLLGELDALSFRIYHHEKDVKLTRLDAELRATLQQLGRTSQRVNKLRDVLLVLGRSLPFISANATWIPDGYGHRIKTLRTDITWLNDQVGHAIRQIQFLQEATIGFIGIEQSHIIKVLAVVATVGVPPTLFASIWGMNFEHMPELKLAFAYPVALSVIVLSGIIPLAWFRRAGWL